MQQRLTRDATSRLSFCSQGSLSTQALVDGLWVMGWPPAMIEGARALAKGQKCVGRAVTLNMVPARPDIAADKPPGMESPEYEAFELCGNKSVLVISSVGPWESVGGDIKFLRLKQLGLNGLVTDGSVRDTDEILSYGFACFSHSTTAKQGPAAMQPWECNGVINCGGIVVRPGDAVVGDQDGVVVVPASHAQQVYDIAHGREVIEGIIKEELVKSNIPATHPNHTHTPRQKSPPRQQLTSAERMRVRTCAHRSTCRFHPPASRALGHQRGPRSNVPVRCASRCRPGAARQVLPLQAADQARVTPWQAPDREGHQILLDPRRPAPLHVLLAGDYEGGVNRTQLLPRRACGGPPGLKASFAQSQRRPAAHIWVAAAAARVWTMGVGDRVWARGVRMRERGMRVVRAASNTRVACVSWHVDGAL